jgi:hypothetical protein
MQSFLLSIASVALTKLKLLANKFKTAKLAPRTFEKLFFNFLDFSELNFSNIA